MASGYLDQFTGGLMRKTTQGLLAAATVGMAVLAVPTAAAAAQQALGVNTGGIQRGACYVYTNGTSQYLSGRVYDTHADGIGVYGRFKKNTGTITDVSDPDGNSPGYGEIFAHAGEWFVAFECVSRDGGSSGWRNL
jgi:hypothetical protein